MHTLFTRNQINHSLIMSDEMVRHRDFFSKIIDSLTDRTILQKVKNTIVMEMREWIIRTL